MSTKYFAAVAIALLSLAFVDAAKANTTYLQQKLTSTSPTAGNVLGNAVAVSGNIALVAANNRTVLGQPSQGAVYVYTYANETWIQTATLTASDGAAGDSFGTSVALSGSSTAIIGAPLHGSGTGAAYVFTRSGGKWTQVAELTANDGAGGDEFGFTVALDGATAVVGALGHNGFQGAAYVFTEPGAAWASTSSPTAELTASDGAAFDEFGSSVAVSGTTVVIGAPEHAIGGNIQQGQVYVFTMPDLGWATTSAATALLTASDGGARDQLGYSVATTGSVILAGAPTHTSGLTQPGGAYLYFEPTTGWATATQNNDLTNATFGTPSGGLFGSAVALTNSEALVGAKWAKASGHTEQGEVYLFNAPSGGWANGAPGLGQILTAGDGVTKAAYGYSVATDGVTLYVGAPHYIDSIQSVAGEAYGLKVTGVSFQFSDGRVTSGKTYMVEATAKNYGHTMSQDVKVSVAVSGGAHVFSEASLKGNCTSTSLEVTCDLGKLAAGASQWMQVNFMVTALPGKYLTNTVTLINSAPLQRLSDHSFVTKP